MTARRKVRTSRTACCACSRVCICLGSASGSPLMIHLWNKDGRLPTTNLLCGPGGLSITDHGAGPATAHAHHTTHSAHADNYPSAAMYPASSTRSGQAVPCTDGCDVAKAEKH